MWKYAAYFFIAVFAIGVGPLMTYRLQNESGVDRRAILTDHESIGSEHRVLLRKVTELSGRVSRLEMELRKVQGQFAAITRENAGRPGTSDR